MSAKRVWHSWVETHEGDEECGRCRIVVAPESMQAFTLPCPAPDCASPVNPDRGCVVTPSRSCAAACVYCGRSGGRVPARELEEPPPEVREELLASLAPDDGYDSEDF